MGIFRAAPEYDRRSILKAAARAQSRRRDRLAIALYRQVLAVEPGNIELHSKLAPLLAANGCDFDAWSSFRFCARAALRQKRPEHAATAYREAARCIPRQVEAWANLADIERRRGRNSHALDALCKGRKSFRGRRHAPEAIALLRMAHDIEPWRPDIVLDLARLLARTQQPSEAQLLLDKLSGRCQGRDLARVRAAQWRIEPTVGNSWRWMQAWSRRADTDHLVRRLST